MESIESALIFDGKAYPDSLVRFPFELTGRGFFPGGDGLWREPSDISAPSKCPTSIDGVMFVGQDFGSEAKYPRLEKPFEQGNATWKYLTKRIEKSGILGESCFFTNALLGLRKSGSTVGPNPCLSNEIYVAICREYLAYQIKIINPRLIVVFGSVQEAIYAPLFLDANKVEGNSNIRVACCVDRKRFLLNTQHPRSDSGVINKVPNNYRARCDDLALAWTLAQAL